MQHHKKLPTELTTQPDHNSETRWKQIKSINHQKKDNWS